MFDSILYFGRKNCSHSKKLKLALKKKSRKFYYIESNDFGEKFDTKKIKNLNFDFIFSFRSRYILKEELINKCKVAPINFHPGPPEYRGPGGINYALYENSKFYGCTAHIINEKIDNGAILNIKKFSLKQSDTVETSLKKTYDLMIKQAFYIINLLSKNSNNLNKLIEKNKNIKWSKKITKLKDLSNFYKINKNISKTELKKKIRATNTKNFKPYVTLHNKKFLLN